MSKFAIATLILASLNLCCSAALASDSSNKAIGSISSTTHLGFGHVRHSNIGQKGRSGSTLIMDVAQQRTESVQLGLRTTAEGSGTGIDSFHRLSTGPYLGLQLSEKFAMAGWFGLFSESATANDATLYHSKGLGIMLSFHRRIYERGALELLWGGYFSCYRGSLNATASIAGQNFRRKHTANTNFSWSQGLTVSAQIKLQ